MVGFGLGRVSSLVHLELYGIISKYKESASRSMQILIRFDWFNSNIIYLTLWKYISFFTMTVYPYINFSSVFQHANVWEVVCK
jgi:hypothetical protein